jgi:hypothetical protein
MSESPTVGFYARVVDGGEVWRMRKDGKPTRRPIKGPLKRGEKVYCPSLFGCEVATVTECGANEARAESEGLIYPLQFASDDRKCWSCSMSLSKRALTSVIW